MVPDINKKFTGDVTRHFVDYSPELNREFMAKDLDSLFGEAGTSQVHKIGFIGEGATKEIPIDRPGIHISENHAGVRGAEDMQYTVGIPEDGDRF